MKELLKERMKLGIYYIAKLMLAPFKLTKIQKNRILFSSLTGGTDTEYSCNPKYIYEYLEKAHPDKYDIVWLFSQPQKYGFLEKQGVHLAKHFTFRSFYYLMTSQVVVTNGSYMPWFPFRRQQTVINTWHGGGAYKKLETGQGRLKKAVEKRNHLTGKNVTAFISSSQEFTKNVIKNAFSCKGEVLDIGMPRNDILVNGEIEGVGKRVKRRLGIEENVKIVLYAPTYRNGGAYEKIDAARVVGQLESITKEKWVCLERYHRYERGEVCQRQQEESVKDVSGYPDMQELLIAADILITDYSSSIWDYSFLNKPCYLYVPDISKYKRERGFYVDISKWHFPYAKSEEELLKQLEKVDELDWKEIMSQHHNMLGNCETGHASEKAVEYIIKKCTV